MNTITQAQFWCHIPTKGGHVQTVRALDGYRMTLDRTSGVLTLAHIASPQIVEVSPSAWISITSEPPLELTPSAGINMLLAEAPQEATKVWTKPKKK